MSNPNNPSPQEDVPTGAQSPQENFPAGYPPPGNYATPPPVPEYTPPPTAAYPPPPGTPPPGFTPPTAGAPGTQDYKAMAQGFIRNAQAVLTKPAVATYDAVQQFANWQTTLLAIGALAVLRGITSVIVGAEAAGTVSTITHVAVSFNPVSDFLGGILSAFIGFFIGVGILWLIAKAFKGQGDFMIYAHALALAFVPLEAAAAVLSIVPFLGTLAGLAVGIYAIYQAILATSSVHRLTMGKSVAVVLIPAAVGAVLALCAIIALSAFLISLGVLHR